MKRVIILSISFFILNYSLNSKFRKLTYREKIILRKNLARTALSYVNSKYRFDCSGFIKHIMKKNHISIFNRQMIYTSHSNGVKLIYNTLKRYHKIFKDVRRANIGDLIFFNNTYDKNRNRRLDDRLTHIAIIVKKYKDGTIKYVHSSNKGIKVGYMNLYRKNIYKYKNRIINSFLRRKKKNDSPYTKYLSGELFYSFGTIF